MRAYIDSENKLHAENDGTMTAVDIDLDGQCKRVIEAYRYYPETGTLILWDDARSTFGAQALYSEMSESISKAVESLDDEHSEAVTELFPFWGVGIEYHKEDKDKGILADRRQYNGILYRCIQSHISQADWTPDIAVSLWVRTSAEEWIPWYQPTGAHDAWMEGMKMAYTDGHHYICLVDGTVYPPDVVPTSWEFVE